MDARSVIRPGMLVIGSDESIIGTIEQVFTSADGSEAWIRLTESGMTLPGSIIDHVKSSGVLLKMTSMEVNASAWDELPTDYQSAQDYEWRDKAAEDAAAAQGNDPEPPFRV